MSGIDAPQIYDVARGTIQPISIDWGENTIGQESGILDDGDTVASAVVTVDGKPAAATDPTFGAVAVNTIVTVINGRSCSAGEATAVTMTVASDALYGKYRLKFVATTTNGFVIPRYFRFKIVEPA